MNAPRHNPRLMKALKADPRKRLTPKERTRAFPPAHVSIIAHQPPQKVDPNAYRSSCWVGTPANVTYTERKSMTLVGWAGVVAKADRMDNSGTGHNKRTPIR